MYKIDKLAVTEAVAWLASAAAGLALMLALLGSAGTAAAAKVTQPQPGNAGS
jgi:multisubunit Na+/H+ antiporter MnhF subunit